MKATDKQVSFLLHLAARNGMSTAWMNSSWKPFASMRERQGRVEDFLAGLSRTRASAMIGALKI